ncbi:AmmeMemoRadiSam system protein A [Aliarcobacter cryaerophilus]|uniref:AmmeMemoRadiSam system protein A n=1 Tax=Aliarcobacter cryaerophilus TaxID=28198 RepID=UPI003DA3A26E
MDKDILINIAKKSIERKFNNKINIDKKELLKNNNFLNEKRASFVTLTLNKELRGCIGSLEANRTLFDDVVNNAYMAAFEDPRFLELSFEEFKKIEIEISILTPPIIVEYKDFEDLKSKIRPYVDGVIIEQDGKRSTFLLIYVIKVDLK